MTITYDPTDPAYFDEADYRAEATRIYDLCQGCRLCWNLCPSFESLFNIVDTKYEGNMELLDHAEQDRIVNECYQCKLCYVKCPYIPPHEWALDFPRLMMRGQAIEYRKNGGKGLGDLVLTRTDLFGKLGTTFAPIANTMMGGRNSLPRKMMQAVTGVAAARELPKYAAQRFSDWFRKYFSGKKQDRSNGSVALFPTCMVEYQSPGIGKDAARVMERNHIGCDLPDGLQCCGMPHLDIGNIPAFRAQAEQNARILARQVRQGKEIVALQPTCAYTLKHEYPAYLKTEDARLVGEHTQDVGEYLMGVHRAEGKGLDTNFSGKVEENISWHIPCHLKAQNIGFKSRDLMRLTGAKVTLVDKCAGIDGGWGLRAENYEAAHKIAVPMVNAIEKAGHTCVAGDCSLANGVIAEETGKVASHPVQILARAYGIPKED